MAFYQEEYQLHKTALSDLQGAWQNLRDEVVRLHPFKDSDKILFQIDEAMSWETVNNLKHMCDIVLLINNIAAQSEAPNEIVESIKWVRDDLDGALEDIASGKIAFHPTRVKRKVSRTETGNGTEATLSATERENYLKNTAVVNWQHPAIIECSARILSSCTSGIEYTQKVFEYVRDEIEHSWDFGAQIVTCSASEVLEHKTGFCYAKSHLLAALLRAQGAPAGFCYQRLSLDENGSPYCLHGLNAVFLERYGWYRIDARGNKEGVNGQFTPPVEQLAFIAAEKLEKDLPEIWCDPLPLVVEALQSYTSVEELHENLPDIHLLQSR